MYFTLIKAGTGQVMYFTLIKAGAGQVMYFTLIKAGEGQVILPFQCSLSEFSVQICFQNYIVLVLQK